MEKTKHQQKRYESEQQILDAIEETYDKALEYDKESAAFVILKKDAAKKAAKEEQEEGDAFCAQFWRDQMEEFKKKSEDKSANASRLRSARLKELGEKLSQMRTEPMMFLAGDKSVPA